MSAAFGTGLAYSLGGIIVELVRDVPAIDLGPLGHVEAWRATFFYVGIPGFFVLLLMLLVREPARRHTLLTGGIQHAGAFDIIRFYRRHWAALTLHHLGYGTAALVGVGIIFWTPTYFQRIHGIPAGEAGTWYGLYFMVFATAGTYWGARLGGNFLRAGHRDAALKATVAGASAMIPIGLVVPMVPDAWMAWILYAPLMFLLNVPFGLGAGSLPVIVPNRLRAQAAAVYTLAVSGLGMGMGPVVVGIFNDHLFPGADGVRLSLALLMLLGGPVWILLLQLCRPHYSRAYAEAEAMESDTPQAA
jgi:MFS family permease